MIDNCELLITFELANSKELIQFIHGKKLANESTLNNAVLREVIKRHKGVRKTRKTI